jgi:hypothetical protein
VPPVEGEVPPPPEKIDISKQLIYTYTKLRKEFGRQERCLQDHFRIHANVKPLAKYRKLVLRKNVVDKEVQAAPGICANEVRKQQ